MGTVLSRMRYIANYSAAPDFADFEEVTDVEALDCIFEELDQEALMNSNPEIAAQCARDSELCDLVREHYARGARAFVASDADGYFFAYAYD